MDSVCCHLTCVWLWGWRGDAGTPDHNPVELCFAQDQTVLHRDSSKGKEGNQMISEPLKNPRIHMSTHPRGLSPLSAIFMVISCRSQVFSLSLISHDHGSELWAFRKPCPPYLMVQDNKGIQVNHIHLVF